MKVQQFYNKNQFLLSDEYNKIFQSYDSTIAKIDKNGLLTLSPLWDYSNTTKKHLYLFLNDYKNNIKAEQYKNIFTKGFNTCNNKTQFIKNLIKNKIVKVSLQA